MRIGVVCPYSYDVPGGVQSHVSGLAAALRAQGHFVEVLAPATGRLPDHVQSAGPAVPVAFNGSVARLAFGPRVAARTRRWLDAGCFDVVHVHEPVAPSVSLLALWATRVPVVATSHLAAGPSRALGSAYALLRPAMQKIGVHVAVSEQARQTLLRHTGTEPVVIPNGIFCDSFDGARPRAEWCSPAPAIVFLGRADEPRKGLTVLLDALPSVVARYPQARLLVAGPGRNAVDALLTERLRPHVRALGVLSDVDRSRLLASASVYVAPQTHGESFGIVLAEAMAAGAPVVASDLPAFRAVLEDGRCGELFGVASPRAAGEAVCRVLDDHDRRAQMTTAASVGVRRYDWSQLVGRVENVYADAVRGGARAGRRRKMVTSLQPTR